MFYIIISIFSFLIGCKFSKAWNMLQFAYLKRKIDDEEIERKIENKYRNQINMYQKEIYELTNKLGLFREYSKNDFEEV